MIFAGPALTQSKPPPPQLRWLQQPLHPFRHSKSPNYPLPPSPKPHPILRFRVHKLGPEDPAQGPSPTQEPLKLGRSWRVLLKILENDGVLGLYAGYSATLLRNLPAGVLSSSSFEYLKSAVLSATNQPNLEPVQSVVCGASASITTPLDVVKTRLMTGGGAKTGVTATVRQILMEEGWVGFTRGVGPRVLHSACFSALGYFAFETARLAILDQYIKRKELQMQELGVDNAAGVASA